MLSIDEAIQRENKIAEENQKIVDTQIVFDDVSIPELYCDDTEVIEEHLDNYKKCVEYHEQIAEWLEELKVLRLQNHLGRDEALIAGRKEGYNKAIDDFANLISQKSHIDLDEDYVDGGSTIITTGDVFKIAEQLKLKHIEKESEE